MPIINPIFWIFLLVAVAVYYCFPMRYRWVILLIASMAFYCWGGNWKPLVYITATAFSTWLAALMIDYISAWTREYLRLNTELEEQEKKQVKARAAQNKKIIFLLVLISNLLILGVIKYANFTLASAARGWGILTSSDVAPAKIDFLVPLGISYYTFQSLGYLIDVYRGTYRAERNLGKYALFVSYFPQILQGPIGRFGHLGKQLTGAHPFDAENLKRGAILMLWGYTKKLVIADSIAPLVSTVCRSPWKYDGSLIVLAVLFYAIQLYADFSGGIDIVSGASEMFGIQLAPNFRRPYFATSLGDFWRRWHISLGGWMRDYVFYPLAMSKPIMKTAKKLKGKSKYLAKAFPAVVGNIVIFLIVGLWHGAEWRFIAWGLYNGVILGISTMMEPLFSKFRERFPRLRDSRSWHGVQILRTLIIVLAGDYFDCGAGVLFTLSMMRRSVLDFHLSAISLEVIHDLGIADKACIALLIALPLLFVVSAVQERGTDVRGWLIKCNVVLRWLLLYALIFFLIGFAASGTNALEGFMYEIF